jgi:hypothetical protein
VCNKQKIIAPENNEIQAKQLSNGNAANKYLNGVRTFLYLTGIDVHILEITSTTAN